MPLNRQNSPNFFQGLSSFDTVVARQSAAQAVVTNQDSNAVPPKASNAPKANTNEVFTGLVEALNTNQQRLVKEGKYQYADVYAIEFAPATLGQATLKRQGITDYSKAPMQDPTQNASAINSATNSTNMTGKALQVSAGMQIVQFIDEIMRSSSYITDQQLYVVDEVTQKVKPNPNPPGGQLAWYKINVQATQLQYDEKRRDHAYNMKFVITPYAINTMASDWFSNSRYRGSHKSYQYWFTGENTQILHFEQDFNNLYRVIISGQNIPSQVTSDFRDQYRRIYLPTSEQHSKTASGYTNEAGDNAAGFLYSPSDMGKCTIRIVGDPAWMQQGEVATGVNASTFNFSPFNADGTINYDSQEIVFDISWNRPNDYDPNTGLVNFNANQINLAGSYNTQPQENATYTAIKCKNIFSKGRFEQEIEGRLLIEVNKSSTTTSAIDIRSDTIATTGTGSTSRNNSGISGEGTATANASASAVASAGTQWQAPTTQTPTANTDGNQTIVSPTPVPSQNPAPSTSDGDIIPLQNDSLVQIAQQQPDQSTASVASPDYNSGLAGTTNGTDQFIDREA